jgi:cytochrome P450
VCDDVRFDRLLVAPEYAADPYPVYAGLRVGCPAHRTPFGARLISRYRDVEPLLADRRLGRAPLRAGLTRRLGPGTALERVFSNGVNFLDGPEHSRLRGPLAASFHRAGVARLRDTIRTEVDRLLAGVEPGGEFDVVATLARPLPVFVICSLLGIPAADRAWLADRAAVISAAVEAAPSTEAADRGQAAMAEITDAVRELMADRRRRPQDDLVSRLATGLATGEAAGLPEDQVVGNLVLLFGAGHETTQTLVATVATQLAERPELAAALAGDEATRRGFIAEALRLESPTQVVGRMPVERVELGEVVLEPGEPVALLVGSAHRDGLVFAEPDRLRLDRSVRHVAFGAGPHYCLGAPLALLEADVAAAALAGLPGKLRPAAPVRWRPTLVMRVPQEARLGLD